MNPIDFIILYLACGAPLGVYFYLQNRVRDNSNYLFLKTITVFILWIPFAIYISNKSKTLKKLFQLQSEKLNDSEIEVERKLYSIQKEMESILFDNKSKISLFEFRQTIERYVGLTVSLQTNSNDYLPETEIFRIAKTKNTDIAAACLQRRNRKLLEFHQRKARQDFLQLIINSFDSLSDTNKLESLIIEYFTLVKDFTAQENLEKIFATSLQTENSRNVHQLEKVLWKPEAPEQLITQQISARLPLTAAMTSSRSKD